MLGDIESLFDMESDPEVKRYLNGPVKKDRLEWIEKMKRMCTATPTLAIELREECKFIGRASLSPAEAWGPPEMQIVLCRSAWGNGYGREAAQLFVAHADETSTQISAIAHPEHTYSHSLLHTFGFIFSEFIQSPDWQYGYRRYYRKPK